MTLVMPANTSNNTQKLPYHKNKKITSNKVRRINRPRIRSTCKERKLRPQIKKSFSVLKTTNMEIYSSKIISWLKTNLHSGYTLKVKEQSVLTKKVYHKAALLCSTSAKFTRLGDGLTVRIS